jgi:IS5 family transposase
MIAAPELLDYAHGAAFIADTGYDSNELRTELKARGIEAVIHSKPERKRALPSTGSSIGPAISSSAASTN